VCVSSELCGGGGYEATHPSLPANRSKPPRHACWKQSRRRSGSGNRWTMFSCISNVRLYPCPLTSPTSIEKAKALPGVGRRNRRQEVPCSTALLSHPADAVGANTSDDDANGIPISCTARTVVGDNYSYYRYHPTVFMSTMTDGGLTNSYRIPPSTVRRAARGVTSTCRPYSRPPAKDR